jgi:spermidine synthase
MEALGRHILVEFYECNSDILNDVSFIENKMVEAAQEAGATVINSTFHHFSPFGVSGVVVIQESHLAIHTWPEYGYAAVDLFTCGDTVDPWTSYNFLKNALKAQHGSSMEINRGQLGLLTKRDYDIDQLRDEAYTHLNPPKFTRNVWFTDRDDNIALSLRHTGDPLFSQKSEFQKVQILETYQYGRLLSCDGMVMCTEKDEYVYHEMISHVAALTHPKPKRVLVIGGGDGGTVRELLRHEQIEEVVMVEIDEMVVNASKEFLPTISSAFGNPRLNLIIDDGIKYINDSPDEAFDIIIVDSTDPVGPAQGLFTIDFYRDVKRVLAENGVLITQSESPRFNIHVFREVYKVYHEVFGADHVFPYLAYIPTYPSGMWSFSFCSKGDVNPLANLDEQRAHDFTEKHNLQYYSEDIHRASFVIPKFVRDLISGK